VEFKPEYIFFGIFGLVACYMIFQIATKGVKGALFGGRIEKTYGEIELEKQTLMRGKLKIHKIITKKGQRIGIEIAHKSFLSYSMVPATLSKEEAAKFTHLLTSAISETEHASSAERI